MNTTAEMGVAQTILAQLGGRRFMAMTGARRFVGDGRALRFRLPGTGGFVRGGINFVRITLNDLDTYDVEFIRLRSVTARRHVEEFEVVAAHDGIYADMLCEVFESETGLRTSL